MARAIAPVNTWFSEVIPAGSTIVQVTPDDREIGVWVTVEAAPLTPSDRGGTLAVDGPKIKEPKQLIGTPGQFICVRSAGQTPVGFFYEFEA